MSELVCTGELGLWALVQAGATLGSVGGVVPYDRSGEQTS